MDSYKQTQLIPEPSRCPEAEERLSPEQPGQVGGWSVWATPGFHVGKLAVGFGGFYPEQFCLWMLRVALI